MLLGIEVLIILLIINVKIEEEVPVTTASS